MNGYKNEWLWYIFISLVAALIIILVFKRKMSETNGSTEADSNVLSTEFITPTNLSVDLSAAELEFKEAPPIVPVRNVDDFAPRARCSRMIKRANRRVRCRHITTFGSEFCFVHKHIADTEKTLQKIKALKEEQHVFNATEYEWKTCDECLNFLKRLNIKDPEKYVPRSTCKNCKLFFRMVEHPEFPIIESVLPPEEDKDFIFNMDA